MGATRAIFHGTAQETEDLVNAVARNCSCEIGPTGEPMRTCSAHWMLFAEQRTLDGLLVSRRREAELLAQEWSR